MWGPPTSTMNFCEGDYAVTPMVAEFWNTLTAAPIIAIGAAGMRMCVAHALGHELLCAYLLVFVIGVGTMAFHATLRREGQILDELPMLWGSCIFIDASVRAADARTGHSNRHWSTSALGTYSAFATVVYFKGGFERFLAMYIASVAALVVVAGRYSFVTLASRTPPLQRRLIVAATLVYVGGFALLWVPGELGCASLPWMKVMPTHALFHLTSTAGPHLYLLAIALLKQPSQLQVARSAAFFGLPAVVGRLGGGRQRSREE